MITPIAMIITRISIPGLKKPAMMESIIIAMVKSMRDARSVNKKASKL